MTSETRIDLSSGRKSLSHDFRREEPKITLRDFREEDIPGLLDYWYRSPAGYVESMGVDLAKRGTEEQTRARWLETCAAPKSKALAIVHEGRAVGVHLINQLTDDGTAVFHAHLWDASLRGQGIGARTYPIACQVFFERFGLERILFKTPLQNRGAIRVKEKLGIRVTGEEVLSTGLMASGTRARCFELTRSEVEQILLTAATSGPHAGPGPTDPVPPPRPPSPPHLA